MTPDRSDEARDLMDRLDRALPPHTRAVYENGDDPLVDAARQLAELPLPALDAEAVNRIEARIQARLHVTMPVSDAPASRHSVLRVLRLAVAACLVIFIFAVVGAAQASTSSLPGDTLYPVKRAIESGRLALVGTNDEAALRIELADRRVSEFGALLGRGDVYPRALEEASDQLWAAGRLLDAGHGDSAQLGPRIDTIAAQQAALATQAIPSASVEVQTRLQTVTGDSTVLHELYGDGTPLILDAVATEEVTREPTEAPARTATASFTPTPTATTTPSVTPTATETATVTATSTATLTLTPTATRRSVTPTRRPPSDSILPEPAATRMPTMVPQPHRYPTVTPGNSENASGQQGGAPGNSENAPGQQDNGPGNSENAPGQQDDGPGNSENAPGQQVDGPGNSENAPGQQDDGPGNSENAPGHTKTDK
ncbi:DUF5667 domain-containing protein [Aggregatilinea lenta]|uniref:DUF5667 domain-containing protein n=1 Tax=Aggregatilinea lenta TaxID=913108 RepID=UPI0013C2DADB|nr:DUF5667 domain-containing protein [Aggregatilinea lenta]